MPVPVTYPGVYIEEIPSGVRSITGVATSITAFVGYTARGPVNKAVRIANFGDYQRNFGNLQQDSEIGYSVQQFFLNGGSDAYVVRVARSAAAAQITLADLTPTPVLAISAASEGVWGNSVRLDIDYQTANPDSTFNLSVTRYAQQNGALVPVETEGYRNLSMNDLSATYAPSAINGDSRLIKVKDLGAAVSGTGWALSKNLSSFPVLTAQDTTISGVLDTTTPFTLVLASVPSDVATLVTQLTAAITAAGLAGKLAASTANAIATNGAGTFVKLSSSTAGAHSGVQILRAASNDLAAKLGLGLTNGGREKEAASVHRPAPNGTLSADLAAILAAGTAAGPLDVNVTDKGTSATLINTTNIAVPAATSGPALRDAIQTALRNIANSPATAQATVQLYGTFLCVQSSASSPNAAVKLGNTLATNAQLDAFESLQEYSLGVGASFGGESGAAAGADGISPGAAELKGDYAGKTGIFALRDVDLFNLLVLPRTTMLADSEALDVLSTAMSFCQERRAFLIVDPNPAKDVTSIGDWVGTKLSSSRNAAVFFPRILVADPLQNFRPRPMPASGAIAGIFARTDAQRGIWKAPAGIDATLQGVQGLSATLTDPENGTLNPLGINCLRTFAVYGSIVWGSRTLYGSDARADDYKYIPVRRLALYLEESLFRGTKWVVFEPNDEPLWAQIRLNLGAFMQTLFRQGAFQGSTPREAYFVKCDHETTTAADQANGIVNILVGFAPLKPAEFVVIQLQQMAGQTSA
jgi:phage tail sheath protein FI